jgi:hypothetical protein
MIRIRYPTSATAIGSAREEFRSYKSSGVAEWSTSGFKYRTVQHFISLLLTPDSCNLFSPDKSPVTRERPINEHSSSSNVLPRDKSPIAAVRAVRAVVAQRKITPLRNRDGGVGIT